MLILPIFSEEPHKTLKRLYPYNLFRIYCDVEEMTASDFTGKWYVYSNHTKFTFGMATV